MAVGPFSEQVRESRVELVEAWSRHVMSLLDLLYQAAVVTEEDVSFVRGGGSLGERDRMRNLLDVLYGRGEDACCAFFKVMPRVEPGPSGTEESLSGGATQQSFQQHLQRHRDILGKEHSPKPAGGSIKANARTQTQTQTQTQSQAKARSYTDITMSIRQGCEVHLQYQHEASMAGELFRGRTQETPGQENQGEICVFREMYQGLLSIPGNGLTLLSGVAGSGKTTVVRRLVHEWSTQTDCEKIILSLSFRELNLIGEPESLQGLLAMHYSHLKPIMADILANKLERVLVILDGLDEFRCALDFRRTPKCSDPERAQPVGALVVNLLKGNLLPGASVLLTSRPHAVSKVPLELVSVFCNMLGFSPAQQQEYFRHNCATPQAGEEVWDYVSTHKPLQLMCHIPAFCWIMSTALHNGSPALTKHNSQHTTVSGNKSTPQSDTLTAAHSNASESETRSAFEPSVTLPAASEGEMPNATRPAVEASAALCSTPGSKTLPATHTATDPSAALLNGLAPTARSSRRTLTITDIYCCFLKSILVFHGGEGREEDSHWRLLQDAPRVLGESRPVLRSLGALAFRGLLERRLVFECSDLAALSLDSADLSRLFLVEILKEDRASLTLQRTFYFIHTSVQEYLAALYFVLEALCGSDPFAGVLQSGLVKLPLGLHRVLCSASKKLGGAKGLLRKHVKRALLWSVQHQSGHMDLFCRFVCGLMVPRTRSILDGLFPTRRRTPSLICTSPPSSSSSLSSSHPPSFLLSLLHSQLCSSSLCPERQVNVCHCLYEAQDAGLSQRLQSWLQVLAQKPESEEHPTVSLEQRDWSELAFLLQLSPDLDTLKLDCQGLDAQGLQRLLPVLPLFRTLSLGQNPLGPEGAAVLSKALRSPACRIEKLWVVKTGLGCEGVKMLTEALKDNRTVIDLRMAINNIGVKGAGHLADMLKTNCTLKDIRLRDNHISDKGGDLLMDALTENSTLQYIWLFDNKFTKDGVKRLKDFSKTRTNLDIKVCV